MANGDHDWTAGETVTAANMDDYLQLQTIEKFATSAARDAALSARKREGMVTYQDDANSLTNYSGAAWSTIGPVNGALTAWTPAIVQSGSVTATNTVAWYQRIGRLITGVYVQTITGSGTASNTITMTLPFAAPAINAEPIGTGYMFDTSTGFLWGTIAMMASTTTIKFLLAGATGSTLAAATLGSGIFTAGLAVGDTVCGNFTYQAAADA